MVMSISHSHYRAYPVSSGVAVSMGTLDFAHSILEFQTRFVDEQACLDYFFACRWPDGFVCPLCHGSAAWPLATRRTWECAVSHHETSLTAGTVCSRPILRSCNGSWPRI